MTEVITTQQTPTVETHPTQIQPVLDKLRTITAVDIKQGLDGKPMDPVTGIAIVPLICKTGYLGIKDNNNVILRTKSEESSRVGLNNLLI